MRTRDLIRDARAQAQSRLALTVRQAVAQSARRLARAGAPTPELDARVLYGFGLSLSPEQLFLAADRVLDTRDQQHCAALVQRRVAGEPVAYITERKEFWSIEFTVGPDVLIPRPDSETLVAALVARCASLRDEFRILDLGTGSGCLLLALLSEFPLATGVGLDRNWSALRIAAANAGAHRLAERARFVCGDWHAALRGRFDVVVSNPPYIADAEIATLARDVRRFEPLTALAGGGDGLDCFRRILPNVAGLLVPGGLLALEFGVGQGPAIARLAEAHGMNELEFYSDLAGRRRCLICINSDR